MAETEERLVSVSFVGKLDSGELLNTGITPTIAELTTSNLTFSDIIVSTAILTISGKSVPLNAAVQFKVVAGVGKALDYVIRVEATSNSSPAQKLFVKLNLKVIVD